MHNLFWYSTIYSRLSAPNRPNPLFLLFGGLLRRLDQVGLLNNRGPKAGLAVVNSSPNWCDNAFVSRNAVVARCQRGIGWIKWRLADFYIFKRRSTVSRISQVNIGLIVFIIVAVKIDNVNEPCTLIHCHPGRVLMSFVFVVTQFHWTGPVIPKIGGTHEPNIRIIFTIALISPNQIQRSLGCDSCFD